MTNFFIHFGVQRFTLAVNFSKALPKSGLLPIAVTNLFHPVPVVLVVPEVQALLVYRVSHLNLAPLEDLLDPTM